MEIKASSYKLNNECLKDEKAALDDLNKVISTPTCELQYVYETRVTQWKYRIPVTHIGPSRIMGSSMS